MNRLFCVPDIHGRNDLLQLLMAKLMTEHALDLTKDKLIFMGDMIDRGPDSKGVIDTIRAIQAAHPNNVIVLRGNHEEFLIRCMRTGHYSDFELWCYPGNGGGATLRSFGSGGPQSDKGIPEEYTAWIENLPLFHEEPGFFFSHAPCPKEKDRHILAKDQPFTKSELIWTYNQDEKGKAREHQDKDGNPIVGVCGHVHALGKNLFCPRYYKHYLFLDAGCGCYHKAPLVCTEVISRTPISIWPEGQEPIGHKKRGYIHESFWACNKPQHKKAEPYKPNESRLKDTPADPV